MIFAEFHGIGIISNFAHKMSLYCYFYIALFHICVQCDHTVLYLLWKVQDTFNIGFENLQAYVYLKHIMLLLFLIYNFVMENIISGGK